MKGKRGGKEEEEVGAGERKEDKREGESMKKCGNTELWRGERQEEEEACPSSSSVFWPDWSFIVMLDEQFNHGAAWCSSPRSTTSSIRRSGLACSCTCLSPSPVTAHSVCRCNRMLLVLTCRGSACDLIQGLTEM